ncbi:MAG: glycosyltransferase [Ruminococcaceae bacterium]|nr:glycosyltransferase [Oscillospiraceae bacterium]
MFDYSQEPGRTINNIYDKIIATPLVSIVTPYYNGSKYLEQTFNSVQNQTFPWFEWIIVNDGSTGAEDVELLSILSKQDARIRVVNQENQGATAARNRGVKESKTEYIFFLDADDLLVNTFVETAYVTLQRQPEAMWAFADTVGFQEQEYLWQKEFRSENMPQENLLPYCSMIRKKVFDDPTVYPNESRNQWEDYQLWLRLLSKSYVPVHIRLPLFWYRRLKSGALAKIEKDPKGKKELENKIKELAKDVHGGLRAVTFGGNCRSEFSKPQVWEEARALPFRNKKTRILLVIPHMACGGADKFNLDLLKNLPKEKYDVGVITTVQGESEWRQEFQKYASEVFELPAFLFMEDWAGFLHYYISTRDVKIVMNLSSYWGYYALPWLRMKFPEIAIIDCVHAEGTFWRAGGYPRVSAALDFVLEKTFVTNDFTKNILTSKYNKPSEKMQVVYTGINEKEFAPDIVSKINVRDKYEIGNRPTVLYLCRIVPEKRPFLMLEIADSVRKQIPDVCFLVVGSGPQLEELEKAINRRKLNKNVIVTGNVDDAVPFYHAADLFLLCSIKEGLSITTMEAQLMELPVISADIGSQYELVDDSTGKLIKCRQEEKDDFDSREFPKDEIIDYSDAIVEMLTDKNSLNNMGKAGRERVLSKYTIEKTIETLDEEFQRLFMDEAMEKRKKLAESISEFDASVADYLVVYQEYESISSGANEPSFWANQGQTGSVYYSAEKQLQSIYSLRSWRIISKLHNFLRNNAVGRVINRFLDIFRFFIK